MKPKLAILLAAYLTLIATAIWLDAQDQTRGQPSAREQERIVKAVRHELLMLPYLGVFDNISYKVDGYSVALFGQVVRPTLKSDAENVVKHIEGVEHVDNQIEVLPVSPIDDGLRRQLYRAIYGYPAFTKYAMVPQKPIRIIVKNGHVTLEGVVDSDGDKNLAALRANGVPSVFSVDNNLRVVKP
jgi:hyperosmotically inducible periplasmic protein